MTVRVNLKKLLGQNLAIVRYSVNNLLRYKISNSVSEKDPNLLAFYENRRVFCSRPVLFDTIVYKFGIKTQTRQLHDLRCFNLRSIVRTYVIKNVKGL